MSVLCTYFYTNTDQLPNNATTYDSFFFSCRWLRNKQKACYMVCCWPFLCSVALVHFIIIPKFDLPPACQQESKLSFSSVHSLSWNKKAPQAILQSESRHNIIIIVIGYTHTTNKRRTKKTVYRVLSQQQNLAVAVNTQQRPQETLVVS